MATKDDRDAAKSQACLRDDAVLLRDYCSRAGLLDDKKLDEAIAAAKHDENADAAMATLRIEVSKAAKAASPYISVSELRAGRDPFGAKAGPVRNRQQIVISVLAIFVIFNLVLGFAMVQDISRDIVEIQRVDAQNPQGKLTELRRMVADGALDDPHKDSYFQYQKLAREVVLLYATAAEITSRVGPWIVAASDGLVMKNFRVFNAELFGGPKLLAGPGGAVSDLAKATAAKPEDDGTPSSPYQKVDTKSIPTCRPYDPEPLMRMYGALKPSPLAAALEKFNDYCLATTLDINSFGNYTSIAMEDTVRALQDEMFFMGVFFLPMVGGLLGSTIFLAYYLMNNKLAATIDWSFIAFRVTAGGAFGVIIGWFASAPPSTANEAIQHISGTPFSLAFLAGFSIESLSRFILKFTKGGL